MSLYVYGGVSVECVHISLPASGMFAVSVKEKERFVRTMASNVQNPTYASVISCRVFHGQ